MLAVRDLRGGYGAVEVLRGVRLDVAAGETVALLGANGAGKTTFASILAGLLVPWSGELLLEGEPIGGRGTRVALDRGLVLVPEGRHVFPNLGVRENLELGSYRRGRARRRANLDRVCDVFPRLAERLVQKAGTLSGGEQQMLAIARALARDIKVLLLDEPYEGLAPVIVDEIEKTLNTVKDQGITTVLVEQNAVRALELADRAVILDTGSVVFDGSAREVLDNVELRHEYLAI